MLWKVQDAIEDACIVLGEDDDDGALRMNYGQQTHSKATTEKLIAECKHTADKRNVLARCNCSL